MVCRINRDTFFLSLPSREATKEDISVGQDLLDTLEAHKDGCVGMVANMIGKSVRIIVFDNQGSPMIMFNPEIVKKSGAYDTEEGCLSLEGVRPVRRYRSIKVQYQTPDMQVRFKTFTDRTAQIIQHEIDHCSGIII